VSTPDNDAARDLHSRAGANEPLLPPNSSPEHQVRRFLELLFVPGDIFEVRVPKCADKPGSHYRSTTLGYYQHAQIAKAVRDIMVLDAAARAPGIYVTLNPVVPALMARAANRLKDRAEEATADTDVVVRRRMLVDADPVRAKGISSTDRELALALAKAQQVRAALTAMGWPEPLGGMSGNGGHLIYFIDLPANDGGLVERVLRALAARFDDESVKIDTSVGNAARITKIMGTTARKGENLVGIEGVEDRPHRRAQLLSVPSPVLDVTKAQLEALAAEVPQTTPAPAKSAPRSASSHNGQGRFEKFNGTAAGVRGYLEGRGVVVQGQKDDGDCTHLYLDRCPINPSCVAESNTDIAVLVFSSGKIVYKNQHNRGTGLMWADVREALEPGFKAWSAGRAAGLIKILAQAPAAAAGPYKTFPVEALPAPLKGYVTAAAKAINCDPGFVALPMLAALAACVGTTRRLYLKRAWKEPCVIWAAIVGSSGTIKSPAVDAGVAPLRLRHADDLSRYQKAIEDHEKVLIEYERAKDLYKKNKSEEIPEKPRDPACIRHIVSDVTIEGIAPILHENPRGVLLERDELAGWVQGFDAYRGGRGGDVAKWLEMHRAGPVQVDRKTGNRMLYIPRAAVSVTGSIQPRVLARVLDEENLANGFAARLLTCAPPKRVKVWTDADIDEATSERYSATVGGLLRLESLVTPRGPEPVDLEFTPAARAIWVKFYNDFGQEQAGLGDEDLAAAFSKLEGYCARFSLLLHLIRAVSGDRSLVDEHRIDEASLEAGSAITNWFCDETERVYAILREGDSQQDERQLVELIRRGGGTMSARQLQHAGRRWRGPVENARAALDVLVRAGIARWEWVKPQSGGGAPTEVCRLLEGGHGHATPPPDPASGGSVTVTGDELPGEERGQWTA